jgi:3-oxoacyl-[acyl-carrier-protein] synthase-1
VADSGSPLTEPLFHISAVSHESFYFRETELAVLRSLEHKVSDYPHLMLSSSIGEVGAASGPLMLAYLASVMPRKDGPGKRGLIHLSNDTGQRTAAIVKWQELDSNI